MNEEQKKALKLAMERIYNKPAPGVARINELIKEYEANHHWEENAVISSYIINNKLLIQAGEGYQRNAYKIGENGVIFIDKCNGSYDEYEAYKKREDYDKDLKIKVNESTIDTNDIQIQYHLEMMDQLKDNKILIIVNIIVSLILLAAAILSYLKEVHSFVPNTP